MNTRDLEAQARLQAQAELAERQQSPPSGDPLLDGYRLVIRALRQPLAVQLPADFASRVAARVVFPEENSSLEDWMTTGLLLGLAVAGFIYVQPVLASVLGHLHFDLQVPTLPWPLLGAAIVSIAVAWALDRGATNWRRHDHSHRA